MFIFYLFFLLGIRREFKEYCVKNSKKCIVRSISINGAVVHSKEKIISIARQLRMAEIEQLDIENQRLEIELLEAKAELNKQLAQLQKIDDQMSPSFQSLNTTPSTDKKAADNSDLILIGSCFIFAGSMFAYSYPKLFFGITTCVCWFCALVINNK